MQRKSQKKRKRVAQVNHPAEKKQHLSRTKKKRNNKRKAKGNNVETTPVKKFRLEEIEQARSYTEKFSSEPSLPYRRLDIFSTLVEGKDSCVAAGLINNQIVVTSNAISAPVYNTEPGNEHVVFVKKILKYFHERQYGNEEKAINLLVEIAELKLAALSKDKTKSLYVSGPDLRNIISYLYKKDATCREWMKEENLSFYDQFSSVWSKKNIDEIEQSKKTRALFARSAERQKIIATMNECWYLARSFKKNQTYFQEHPEINDFKILAVGNPGEHAELRLTGYLLEAEENIKLDNGFDVSTIHIGLSKLCCAECARLVDVVNETLKPLNASHHIGITAKGESGEKITISTHEDFQAFVGAHQMNEMQDQTGENKERGEESETNPDPLSVTGRHGLNVGGAVPRYFSGEFYLATHFPKSWSAASQTWSLVKNKHENRKTELESFYKRLSESYQAAMGPLHYAIATKETNKERVDMTRSVSNSPNTPYIRPENKKNEDIRDALRAIRGAPRALFFSTVPDSPPTTDDKKETPRGRKQTAGKV